MLQGDYCGLGSLRALGSRVEQHIANQTPKFHPECRAAIGKSNLFVFNCMYGNREEAYQYVSAQHFSLYSTSREILRCI